MKPLHISTVLRTIMPDVMVRNRMSGYEVLQRCASPIEKAFAMEVRQWLAPGVDLEPQVGIVTRHGAFRLDFAIGGVGIECDGAAFHLDKCRDRKRDALILATGRVRTIYRLEGADIVYRCDAILLQLLESEPDLFRPQTAGWLEGAADPRLLVTPSTLDTRASQFVAWAETQPPSDFDTLIRRWDETRRSA